MKQYQGTIPYIEQIGDWYNQLHKEAFDFQMERAMQRPQFRIGDTPFSTVTVNRTFRTGLHKDKGDYGGVACLSVLEHGEYNGGIFLMPAYGIGVDLRAGDPKIHKDNISVGTLGAGTDYSRISLVCYLRERMIECPQPQFCHNPKNLIVI